VTNLKRCGLSECVAEAFDTTHNVLILVYPVSEPGTVATLGPRAPTAKSAAESGERRGPEGTDSRGMSLTY